METILLAFSNLAAHPLPTLQEEDDNLSRLLSSRARDRHFLLHRESFATLEKTAQAITLYRDHLVLFLYSGHATRDALILPDHNASASGIGQMLGQCPNLKLVFLNGCSTQGQVETLLHYGIPVVLATSAPVDDRKATFFSIRFFEALQQQFSLREAFDMARGAVEAASGNLHFETNRSFKFFRTAKNQPIWGLFSLPEKTHVLNWKLPAKPQFSSEISRSFIPNQYLIDTLFRSLAMHSVEIQMLSKQEADGIQISLPKKRIAVLNALPAPLAEPLRKLMVPVEQENEGYDKIGETRIRQLHLAHQTALEMFVFILLAQLWEACDAQPNLHIEPAQRSALLAFLRLNATERQGVDFLPLIRTIHAIFDKNNIQYFLSEMRKAVNSILEDDVFAGYMNFLRNLAPQFQLVSAERPDQVYRCEQAEQSLAALYEKTGFMAQYKLATIQGIDVEKYRHRRIPRFNHETVVLHDLLGGFAHTAFSLEKSLDNRSVLLINEATWEYLNLSPFALDENAFQDKTEVCKLYFFSHYLPGADCYCYKYVNKPDDPLLEVSDRNFALVKEQFEAFAARVLLQPLRSA